MAWVGIIDEVKKLFLMVAGEDQGYLSILILFQLIVDRRVKPCWDCC
jgi:hypothetical protein